MKSSNLETLEAYFSQIHPESDKAAFIKTALAYIDHVESNDFFQQVFLAIKEYQEAERIERMRYATTYEKRRELVLEEQVNEHLNQGVSAQGALDLVRDELSHGEYARPNVAYKYLLGAHKNIVAKTIEITRRGTFSTYLGYNEHTQTLYLQNKPVQICMRERLTNAHHLLVYLFAHEPFEQHFVSEMNDDNALLEPRDWKRYYDACTDIQKKVEKATDIQDFLEYRSGERMFVRINPKYRIG